MPTDIQYALMAANAYSVKATVTSEQNAIPVPRGFFAIERRINDLTGFTARAFGNSPENPTEIVIAYTGTTDQMGQRHLTF